MELSEIIIRKIKDEGPISFQHFMEMCLYYPDLGYYTSTRKQIGKNGDFYTSACLTPVFGALIGKQLEEMWRNLGESDFKIVEYGSGTGSLCRDILNNLRNNKKMYDRLQYCIIEKSPSMREEEKRRLQEKVCWYDSIGEIPEVNGCVISNELVDNFSVHRVVMKKELMEVFVDYQNGFVEILKPAREELKQYLLELGVELSSDFCTEINLQAINWIREIAVALKRGYVLTIDYGCQSEELYKSYRREGTMLCYYKHSVSDQVFDHIGSQDITSHVNFTALSHWGTKNGLNECGFTDQCHFLLGMGFKEYIHDSLLHETDVVAAAKKASLLSRTLLMNMGNTFKVLLQEKGMAAGEKKLSGFRLSYPENKLNQ